MPTEGYGKFELNVHSNDCYTAAGPTKLTGFLTITDAHGKEVTNPAFEFDGCFDPQQRRHSHRRPVPPQCSTQPAPSVVPPTAKDTSA